MHKLRSARRAASPVKEASPKCFLWLRMQNVPGSPRRWRSGPGYPQGPGWGVPNPRELLPWLDLPGDTCAQIPPAASRAGHGCPRREGAGEKQICGAASAWSLPLQTLREAGGSWAHIWGAESLCELQASRQEWAEGAEPPVPTPRFSRFGNPTQTWLFPPGSAAPRTIHDGSQILLSPRVRCGNPPTCSIEPSEHCFSLG